MLPPSTPIYIHSPPILQDDSDTDTEMLSVSTLVKQARPFIRHHQSLSIDLEDDSDDEGEEDIAAEMLRLRERITRMESEASIRRSHAFHLPSPMAVAFANLPTSSFIFDGEHHQETSSANMLEIASAEVRKIEYYRGRLAALVREQAERKAVPITDQVNISAAERTIFVGNIGKGRTHAEIRAAFGNCGAIPRVTIRERCAYIEFACRESVALAVEMSKTFHFGKKITVRPMRPTAEKPYATHFTFTPPAFQFTFSCP